MFPVTPICSLTESSSRWASDSLLDEWNRKILRATSAEQKLFLILRNDLHTSKEIDHSLCEKPIVSLYPYQFTVQ
jgi:hypothetical protein